MAVVLEGYNASVSTSYTTLSSSTTPRSIVIQCRNNVFVKTTKSATFMVVLGETTGSTVDLGVQPPNEIQVAAISGTAEVSMWSLHPGERR
jgi:hypothetical protein